ncbi:putative ripening-related protein 6 [Triticum urartu]|uniref:putative ripening-related protein 6 n=1 Tax=Triticum urartu TaxID=4572 RepID=UPI0020433B91|nr:putative ripening-related protein 6 [Triticum urartu]XP_048538218.1 putative ripening-related protein 6 [Triticum urartu]
MASSTKVVVIFGILVLLQVSCTASEVRDLPAVMSVNGFENGEEGGPASCDGQYHNDDLFLVSMASKWYGTGLRCGKMISIKRLIGTSVQAMVVDDCGDGCGDNEISTSAAVWKALGIDTSAGEVPVLWSDV